MANWQGSLARITGRDHWRGLLESVELQGVYTPKLFQNNKKQANDWRIAWAYCSTSDVE